MRYRLAALVAVAGIATGAALAVATPVTPQPGAVVTTSHPLFTWTLPANEQSDALYIADTPHTTTPEGKFYDENVVDLGIFFSNTRQWSPTSPIYAGAYWWLVWSHDANTFQSYYNAPVAFTIPAALTLLPVKTHRYLSLHWLDVTVRWNANVHGLIAKGQASSPREDRMGASGERGQPHRLARLDELHLASASQDSAGHATDAAGLALC